MAERSYPTSEVRGRSWENPMPEGRRPRGVTPRLRSGAAAESARLRQCRNGQEELPTSEVRGCGWEELPHVQGQGQQPRGAALHLRLGWQPRGATPRLRPEVAAGRTYPMPKARGSGLEDLPHARGQGPWLGGATPPPRTGGCKGVGGPRGAIPRSRSEGAAVRRYPSSSKVRSNGCALLEQL